MIKAVIFDLDGTLADTLPDLRSAMNRMLSEFRYPERSREEILAAICYGQLEFVLRSLPPEVRDSEETVEKCRKYYSACYDRCFKDETTVYEGMPEVIEELRSRGISVSVVTNKAQGHADMIMAALYPGDAFTVIIGGSKEAPSKPDPTTAMLAASAMGADPRECAFVGDSDVDIKTGINAGMHPIGVTWGYRDEELLVSSGAESVAHTPEELLKYLLGL